MIPFSAPTLLRAAPWLLCAALALAVYVQTVKLGAAQDTRDTALQRVQSLGQEVLAANDAISQCDAANQSRDAALQECHAHTGDLARESRRLDELLAAARRDARKVRAERDREDRELAARPEVPLEEAIRLERARGEGWLWR